jgi:hypothetical protein
VTVRACFVTASGQNAFFGELLSAIRGELEAIGIATEEGVDHFPVLTDDLVYVFIPHEYLPLTYPEAHPSGAQIARTVVLNTEQPGTHWFKENATTANHTGVAVDINQLGADELARRGVSTRRLRLGYVPGWDRWGGRDVERPIDFTFLGGYNVRRARILASCGHVLHGRRSAIHLVESGRPHTAASETFLRGDAKWDHLARSKVLLNLHRDEQPYFEWQRVIEAIANGCVVVSEHSLEFEPLVPGVHFVSATPDSVAHAVAALLEDGERLPAIRHAAYEFLRREMPLGASILALIEAIEEVAQRPVRRQRSAEPTPLPMRPTAPEPDWVRLLTRANGTDLMRMALKRIVVGQQQLERQLSRLEDGDAPAADKITTFGPYAETNPKVTVAVTLFNYEGFIAEALCSVAMSDLEEIEVVLVDDDSTDGSLATAKETLASVPWLAGKIVARGKNQGLPAARNLAIEHARAEYVFILDADNLVYPHALSRLAGRLDEDSDAAFAYGILEKFDTDGPYDLISWLAWDPKRLRYGNFVDAMALVRRSGFAAVGGYTTDPRLVGLEDLAFWCAMAEAGMAGAFLPEIVARYRAGRHSMISLTNIDASEAWSVLLERFPMLRSA